MRVVLAGERMPLPKQMHYELLLKKTTQFLVCQTGLHQRWLRIRSAGVDSGSILRFSFGPGAGVKNL